MAKTLNKAAFMKVESAPDAAEFLGHGDGGKKVRARLRANGIRLSKGGKFDRKAKELLWGIFVEGKAKAAKTTKAKSTKARTKKVATPKPETAPAE